MDDENKLTKKIYKKEILLLSDNSLENIYKKEWNKFYMNYSPSNIKNVKIKIGNKFIKKEEWIKSKCKEYYYKRNLSLKNAFSNIFVYWDYHLLIDLEETILMNEIILIPVFINSLGFLNNKYKLVNNYIPYITVSHVWYEKYFINEIDINIIEVLIKSSIKAKVKYVWIDTFCVINVEEKLNHINDYIYNLIRIKEIQLQNMWSIYFNAKAVLLFSKEICYKNDIHNIEKTLWARRAWTIHESFNAHKLFIVCNKENIIVEYNKNIFNNKNINWRLCQPNMIMKLHYAIEEINKCGISNSNDLLHILEGLCYLRKKSFSSYFLEKGSIILLILMLFMTLFLFYLFYHIYFKIEHIIIIIALFSMFFIIILMLDWLIKDELNVSKGYDKNWVYSLENDEIDKINYLLEKKSKELNYS